MKTNLGETSPSSFFIWLWLDNTGLKEVGYRYIYIYIYIVYNVES